MRCWLVALKAMALIFNSITQFEIQPERTKRRVKRDDLDTLTEVWTGPSDQEDIFVPPIGSVHPQFNLMTVINTSIKRMAASVSEVTINYQGKLDNSGSGAYTSVPEVSTHWTEGEVSYQRAAGTSIPGMPGSGFGVITAPGVATYSRRYTGRCVDITYITNRRPTGNPTNIGLSKDYLGFLNEWEVPTGFQGGATISGSSTTIKQMTCTDVKVEARADGWYRVTETYQSRQFPGAVSISQPANAISTRTAGSGGGLGGQANWAAQEAAAMKTAAAAKAAQYGISLPESGPGTVGEAVRNETGIDPAWTSAATWTINVSTDSAGQEKHTLASVSTPLDM
jgi:hypothetical protein